MPRPGAPATAVRGGLGLAFAILAVVLVARPAYPSCVAPKRADVPVRMRDGFAFVPASVGGTPVTFLLDTGAQGMLLTPEAAETLGLAKDPGRSTQLLGTGGSRSAPNAILHGLTIGGAALPDSSVPVAVLPGVPHTEPMLAGLLGAPLLEAYDLDLDLPRARMALYDAGRCGTVLPGPAQPFSMLPILMSTDGEALVSVRVNGRPLLALVDTGSRATMLTEEAAQRLGLGGPASANVARGVDGAAMPVRHLRVATLQVGTDVAENAPVSVSPLQLGGGDMLLGLDHLRRRRVWISFRSARVILGPLTPG